MRPQVSPHTSDWVDSEEYSEYSIRLDSIKCYPKIVLLGDSQTQNANWNEILERNELFNSGIKGDITLAMKTRVSRIIKLVPEICFIQGGINDLNLNIPIDTIVNNMNEIVGYLQQNNIKPILNTVGYTSRHFHNQISDKITLLNEKSNSHCR